MRSAQLWQLGGDLSTGGRIVYGALVDSRLHGKLKVASRGSACTPQCLEIHFWILLILELFLSHPNGQIITFQCVFHVLDDKSEQWNELNGVKNLGKLDTFSLDCLGSLFLFISLFIHLSECHLMDPCSVLEPLTACVWRWQAVLNGTTVSLLLGNLQANGRSLRNKCKLLSGFVGCFGSENCVLNTEYLAQVTRNSLAAEVPFLQSSKE